jgi:nitrous oxidase accessory protein NosD
MEGNSYDNEIHSNDIVDNNSTMMQVGDANPNSNDWNGNCWSDWDGTTIPWPSTGYDYDPCFYFPGS